MSFVVVTIRDERGESRDLELPADVPVSTLGPAIAQAVHHPDLSTDDAPVKAVLKIDGRQEVIPLDKSLESAGVVHGDILLLMVKEIPSELAQDESRLRFSGPGFMHPSGRTYPFRGKNILIGRVDQASGIVSKVLGVDLTDLEDPEGPSVSRRHAQVLLRDGEYLIQDLRSTNGTIVNKRLLPPETRTALQHGDEIQIGDITLFFMWDAQERDLVLDEQYPEEKEGQE
jgi:uncharacterized ubiquitin-like protein YukD